jgi:hypothetical protein
MRTTVKAGVVLAVAVAVLMFVNGFAGVYKNPSLGWVFPVFATLIEIGVLIWALRQTAREGRGYGAQVGAGVLIAVIGGALIIPIAMIWAAMFPDWAQFAEAAMADGWADSGMSEEQIQQMIQSTKFMRTGLANGIFGFLATVVTGLVASLIIAAFVRKKD